MEFQGKLKEVIRLCKEGHGGSHFNSDELLKEQLSPILRELQMTVTYFTQFVTYKRQMSCYTRDIYHIEFKFKIRTITVIVY